MTVAHPLVDFLLARIAEDETVARAATEWWEKQLWSEIDEEQYLHVDRHRPARVLAECAAKRQVIQRHRERADRHGTEPTAPDRCAECQQHDWPCPSLRALGSVYADHFDYDDTWRI